MALRKLRCAIEQLADWHPRLFLEPHTVACAAVLSQYSSSPAPLAVECENIASRWLGKATGFLMEVSWLRETAAKANRLQSTVQTKPFGGYGGSRRWLGSRASHCPFGTTGRYGIRRPCGLPLVERAGGGGNERHQIIIGTGSTASGKSGAGSRESVRLGRLRRSLRFFGRRTPDPLLQTPF